MDWWTFRSGTDSVQFGSNLSGVGLVRTPEVRSQVVGESSPNPRGDGTRFGVDRRPGSRVLLDVEFRPDDGRTLDMVVRDFARVWRADQVRRRGGPVAELTSLRGRTAFGRPQEFVPDQDKMQFDIASASAEFRCVDDLWYGPADVVEIGLVPPAPGGLEFPAEAPFTFDSGPTVRSAAVVVGGDVATEPVFTITGPISNPGIDVVGVGQLRFATALAYDQALQVSTRHWERWVLRDGAPVPGALSPSGARLSDMSLEPGAYSVLLRGYDTTGTATLRVETRPAYTSF